MYLMSFYIFLSLEQISSTKKHVNVKALHTFFHPSVRYLVLVFGVAVTQISYQPDEMGFEADDRGMIRRISICTEGGEVLRRAENILAGLPYSVHLLQ